MKLIDQNFRPLPIEETEALIYKLEKYCNNNYIDMYAGQSLVYYVTRQEPYKIYHTTF